jgi:uncharacterized protein (TIGR02266 family)
MKDGDSHRRAHERALLEVEVTLESENNFYAGITNDVSEGGVFVATVVPLPVGASVALTLRLGGEGPSWDVTGEVRWIRELEAACEGYPPGCGIRWRFIPDEALAAIRAFVAERDTILFDAA